MPIESNSESLQVGRFTAFLLGSGISIPAKLPSVADLTNEVLCGHGWHINTKGIYDYNNHPQEDENNFVWHIQNYLRILKAEIDRYYASIPCRTANYEDLYYVSEQIADSESFEYDNPAVKPLIGKLLPDFTPIMDRIKYSDNTSWSLYDLANGACNFIRDVVWRKLQTEPQRLDHLKPFLEAAKDSDMGGVDIFTLNHDTLLEKYFYKNIQKYCDGFGQSNKGVRYWQDGLFESGASKSRIFKLHGSINWFRFKEDDGSFSDIGIPLKGDPDHQHSPSGRSMMKYGEGRPLFLAGTFNKMLRYTSNLYADLFYMFRQTLKQCKQLVVCGYGFNDKGINAQIAEWISANKDRKLLIIHPDRDELKRTVRGAIYQHWDRYLFIDKKIEDTTWEEIKLKLEEIVSS